MSDVPGQMRGKIVLVTGATNGIGLVTARELATRGATIALVGRDRERLAAAEAALRERGSESVHTFLADLSVQAQVRELAQHVQDRFDRLDVLINNAGAVFARRGQSADGIEMTLALNHLAPFLLTNLLLDMLRRSDAARIVTVASVAHRGARAPLDDMNQERRQYQAFRVYGESKLLNIMFTYALARRLQGSRVTSNAVHPGFVASNFGKDNGGLWRGMFTLSRPFSISVERGAETSVYVASASEVAGISGKYFSNKRPAPTSRVSYDVDAQERLWRISEEMTQLSRVEQGH